MRRYTGDTLFRSDNGIEARIHGKRNSKKKIGLYRLDWTKRGWGQERKGRLFAEWRFNVPACPPPTIFVHSSTERVQSEKNNLKRIAGKNEFL